MADDLKTCPHCGAIATANRTKCWHCGKRIKWFKKISSLNKAGTVVVTSTLLVINLLCFFLLPPEKTGILPNLVWNGEFWRLFTCMFTHFDIGHIACNMFSLLIIGTRLERHLGSLKYLLIYVLCGLGGAIASLLLTRGFSGGASGAIMGLFGLIIVYTWITRTDIDGLSQTWTMQVLILNILFAFVYPNIDHWGHAGGFIVGALYGLILVRKVRGRRFIRWN